MRNTLIELTVTIILGVWIVYRLAIDSMNYVEPGWHTTGNSQNFQQLKLIGLLLVTLGIIGRVVILIRTINRLKKKDVP